MKRLDIRSRRPVARLRWTLLPWTPYAWRYHDDLDGAPNPGHWWTWCWGSFAYWLDRLLDRLPGSYMFISYERWRELEQESIRSYMDSRRRNAEATPTERRA